MGKKVLKELEKLNKEKVKDFIELESEKQKLIKEIKQVKKEDIIPQSPKKISLWNRIKKVLMGL